MDNISKTLALAETYLDDMVAADQAEDYEAWMQHFDKDIHKSPSKQARFPQRRS